MDTLTDQEKFRRVIGAGLLVLGTLCIIWGETSNNPALLKFGKPTAVVGIVIYFLGRIGRLLRTK